jgi:aspartyl-tRNA(Asn)/glutamyl-tRNA(Gln) amidotransferase subunit C
MEITDHDVRHLERLAALRLSAEDRARMREHLHRILMYMEALRTIDVEGVPPTSHVMEAGSPLREDRVEPSDSPEIALRNAPDGCGSFFRVPRFVGDSEAGS